MPRPDVYTVKRIIQMSQNENNLQKNEELIKALFRQVENTTFEPSLYLKTRVLIHIKEGQKQQKTLRFWQFFSAGSCAVMLLIGFYSFHALNAVKNDGIANQAYVIHVEFDQSDLSKVAKAEVILPDEVSFMSPKGKVHAQQKMTLPVQIKTAGRGKLPFVVSSSVEGEKKIRIRLLDADDNLVREQVIKFKFAKTGQQVNL